MIGAVVIAMVLMIAFSGVALASRNVPPTPETETLTTTTEIVCDGKVIEREKLAWECSSKNLDDVIKGSEKTGQIKYKEIINTYIAILDVLNMLAERTDYLSAGVHIGMKSCTKYLRQFVYKVRDDGLAVFNLRKVDARIAIVANFLSGFDNVLVVSRKNNAADAITKFAEVTGSKAIAGRFSPGTLTNPSYRDFFEPDVVVTIDPIVDENAVK